MVNLTHALTHFVLIWCINPLVYVLLVDGPLSDPRCYYTHVSVWQVAGFFAVIWGINLLVYVFSDMLHIPAYSAPLSLVAFVLLYLINPFRVLHYRARRWLLRVMVLLLYC